MPINIRQIKDRISKLKTIAKLPTGQYSEDDDNFIKDTITKFRESIIYLSEANQDEFEEKAKNYTQNLNECIIKMENLLQFIQAKCTGKNRKTG